MPAEKGEVGQSGKLHRLLLIEHPPLGRKVDQVGAFAHHVANGGKAVDNGLHLHNHPHPAAKGGVVDLLLLVFGVVADVMAMRLKHPLGLRPAEDALPHHPLAHLGEEG